MMEDLRPLRNGPCGLCFSFCLLVSWTVDGTGIHVEVLDYENLFITWMLGWVG